MEIKSVRSCTPGLSIHRSTERIHVERAAMAAALTRPRLARSVTVGLHRRYTGEGTICQFIQLQLHASRTEMLASSG